MPEALTLRPLQEDDPVKISNAFKTQGWDKPIAQYKQYYAYQEAGIRDVIVAEFHGEFAGYLTIQWESHYPPFSEKSIPEIVDFNVLKQYQRQGIGTALMDEAEERIKKVSPYAGIGFGVYQDYGPAQILYIKRNYVPDGNGLIKNSKPIQYGENITLNDEIALCLIKEL